VIGHRNRATAARLVGLDRATWGAYLDSLVHGAPQLAAVAIAQPGQSARRDRLRRPLQAIRYEAKADEVEVVLVAGRYSSLRYFISTPRSIIVEELDRAKVLRVSDATGVQTAIHVFDVSREFGSATPLLAGA
jgi:hypothetical protein